MKHQPAAPQFAPMDEAGQSCVKCALGICYAIVLYTSRCPGSSSDDQAWGKRTRRMDEADTPERIQAMFLSVIIQYLVLLAVAFLIATILVRFFRPQPTHPEAAHSSESVDFADSTPVSARTTPAPSKSRTAQIVLFTIFSRVFLCFLAYLAAMLFMEESSGFLASYRELWIQSDAPHYLTIAEDWYVSTGEDAVLLVFLPLYPFLIRLFTMVLGNSLISGILLSLSCYAASAAILYRCTLQLGYDEDTAFRSVKYLILFPASFFVLGSFTESLFILLTLLFFLYLLRKNWLLAAIFGSLAAFTRYYGILLVVPYGIEYLQHHIPALRGFYPASHGSSEPASHKAKIRNGFPVLLIPAGTGLYLIINYFVAGDPFRFLTYQREHWHQSFGFFFDNVGKMVLNALSYDAPTSAALFVPQIAMILLVLALLLYGVLHRFRLSMLAYLTVYFIISLSATWLLSFPRYMFGAAPIFILLAAAGKRRTADMALSFFCGCGLVYLMLAYICQYHVY